MQEVVPKGLENIESSSKNWFHEARSHLIIGNKWATIVQCFGIAQDPSNGNYMLYWNTYVRNLIWITILILEHNYDLAMNIFNGPSSKIVSETPLQYRNLMEQCWDAVPSKRPDIFTILKKMDEINLYYQNISSESLN
ncbi:kinase-like domain-containing protein [Rhizophagus clarus]|uniref:Kinase-like domain-containing protein n=1 Tax=Rhizophagus clarus TaxID=94130 RepID=A0A8H3L659_9GLOM|nr:kinase-like domain-containing protein [Rhizophagus clarus]